MQIKNPSSGAIENVKIFGVLYSIEALGTLNNVPEAHARYWQENLHKFIILKKDKLEEAKEEVVEIPEPKVAEVVPEVIKEEEVIPVIEPEITKEAKEEVVEIPTPSLVSRLISKKGK